MRLQQLHAIDLTRSINTDHVNPLSTNIFIKEKNKKEDSRA